jgi:RNA polymerase sigma-70 factor (ECF subfamily)
MSNLNDSPERGSSLRSTMTSPSLLDRVRAEETGAWDRLVTLYAPLVYSWCRRWDLNEHDIADVFQEVFLAVATHIGTFRKDRASDTFRGWLRTITRNKVLDHFRRLGREPGAIGVGGTEAQLQLSALPAPGVAEEPSAAEEQSERSLFYRGLDAIRAEFELRTWQAFWKTVVEGRSAKDVAADLGMSAGAVRVAKSRVLHRLRDELGDLMD